MLPPPELEWTAEGNDERWQHVTTKLDNREAVLKTCLAALQGDLSFDYPHICETLQFALHPLLQRHVAPYQPKPVACATPAPAASDALILDSNSSTKLSIAEIVPAVNDTKQSSQVAAKGKKDSAASKPNSAKTGKKAEPTAASTSPPFAATSTASDDTTNPITISTTPSVDTSVVFERKVDDRDTLQLERYRLDAATLYALSLCLPYNRTITTLRIAQCTITANSLASLLDALASSAVQILSLTACTIEDSEGSCSQSSALLALQVTKFLATKSSLQYLDLSHNNFSDASCGSIIDACKSNSTLLALDLSSGDAAELAANSLASLLAVNNTLQFVSLCKTLLSSEHLRVILTPLRARFLEKDEAKALKKDSRVFTSKRGLVYREANTGLRMLDLRFTAIDASDAAIVTALSESELGVSNADADEGTNLRSKLQQVLTGRSSTSHMDKSLLVS